MITDRFYGAFSVVGAGCADADAGEPIALRMTKEVSDCVCVIELPNP